MINAENIDSNFKIETAIQREGLTFFDAKRAPIELYGVFHDGKLYRRIPEALAKSISENIEYLSENTAGGRVRFLTDSPYVAIKAVLPSQAKWSHMPRTAEFGFDMYVTQDKESKWVKTFVPPVSFNGEYESVHDFIGEPEMRLITINFPLYNPLHELYIGLKEGAALLAPSEYTISKPIVYYGSSITQGGCASRPGTSYQAFISRRYDADYINLGFSGNGRGEPCMAEYIAGIDMSLFVYDYDHNAPTVEHYRQTHEPFFKIIREKHPELPIVIMTRPKAKHLLNTAELERLDIARETYDNARAAGDKNVYFVPGYELVDSVGYDGTVDGTHLTDLGFFFIAERLVLTLDEIFQRERQKI